MNRTIKAAALAVAALCTTPAFADTTDFASGPEGWVGNGEVSDAVGTPAPAFYSQVESFGLSWRNTSNPSFVGDYGRAPSVTISLDVLTNSITYLGNEVSRGLFVKLVSFGPEGEEAPPAATVYYQLGTISAATAGWQNFTVTIDDTTAALLPGGWGGVNGDGELQLPDGLTFADVLANVDQIEFTTFEPGFFYGFTIFDVAGDNFTVDFGSLAAVPEPASWAMMIGGMGVIGGSLRTRKRTAAIA